MIQHPITIELLVRERIEDLRRDAEIARRSRVPRKTRSRQAIRRRKVNPAW